MKVMKDPPKKKHSAKARPAPVVPLSDMERQGKAKLEFVKALRFLEEAEKLAAWGGAPHACVHCAYYAHQSLCRCSYPDGRWRRQTP